ncbi:MAG: yrrB 8 [Planctomycetaceae bacterium]|nr:yrrB 8 [Planctomycetaceae bacterium]
MNVMQLSLTAIIGLQFAFCVAGVVQKNLKVTVIQPVEMRTSTGKSLTLPPGTPVTIQSDVEEGKIKIDAGRIGWADQSVLQTLISADAADTHFSKLIELHPKDAAAWAARGTVRFHAGKHDEAIRDFDQSLNLAPDSLALTLRGFAWKRKGDKDKAMQDFHAAIKLNPKEALAWRVRGATWAGKANYAQALADYSESIRLDPENPDSLHHRVVMLSACNDDKIRNGKQAVADATQACELSGWNNSLYLSGLGMAYAELGEFESAIKWYSKAMELSSPDGQKLMQSRLELFRMHKPFRTTWK